MKDLLMYVIQNLVDNPDEIQITERDTGTEVVFEIRVADNDMGKIIGRQGRVVKDIRTLMKTVAQRQFKRVSVDIMD